MRLKATLPFLSLEARLRSPLCASNERYRAHANCNANVRVSCVCSGRCIWLRRMLAGGYVAHATVSIIGASPVLRYLYRPPQVAHAEVRGVNRHRGTTPHSVVRTHHIK